ncbi:MAG: hypothetical protein HC888_01670 [Candidatus Competibacteraceae bacterium]|nr:hypothetical protein [Candidatus Competibacteraceae bacterium]
MHTGNYTNYAPDAQKPKFQDPTKNIQLSSVYDSRAGRFIASQAQGDHSRIDEHKARLKANLKLKDMPSSGADWKSKEFKAVSDPFTHHIYNDVDTNDDDVMKSCIDLAIDE